MQQKNIILSLLPILVRACYSFFITLTPRLSYKTIFDFSQHEDFESEIISLEDSVDLAKITL